MRVGMPGEKKIISSMVYKLNYRSKKSRGGHLESEQSGKNVY